jgi:alpha-ketoglutarate-dependent taurine dioxygenase
MTNAKLRTAAAAISVRRLTPTIGAEVLGVDLSRPLAPEMVAAIRAAWLEHLVLIFPDQEVTPEQQIAFATQFGAVTSAHPVEPALEHEPRVLPVDSERDRNDYWHTDVTFMARPPMASILYASVVPDYGGDTMWSNLQAAYDMLAEPLRHLCDALVAYHYSESYAADTAAGNGKEWDGSLVERMVPVEHPVVREHPETGRRGLFVNPHFTLAIKGFPAAQSRDLLALLHAHTTRPEFICRHAWTPGSLAMWDNRATMHYAVNDYGSDRRLMHRVTLRGEIPFGPARPRAEAAALES